MCNKRHASPLSPETEWVVANQDLCERQGYTVRGLPVGEKINFRVSAKNLAGVSPPATLAQPVTVREIVGGFGPGSSGVSVGSVLGSL